MPNRTKSAPRLKTSFERLARLLYRLLRARPRLP